MAQTFSVKQVCQSCNGTGLYIGMGEGDGAAIVCRTCEGTGCKEFTHTYEVFTEKRLATNVRRIYRNNPGICIGENHTKLLYLEDFGGMPYEDWVAGKDFPRGSEDRKHTCPYWYYQSVEGISTPNWESCRRNIGREFSQCKCFPNKHLCWEKWDKEH